MNIIYLGAKPQRLVTFATVSATILNPAGVGQVVIEGVCGIRP